MESNGELGLMPMVYNMPLSFIASFITGHLEIFNEIRESKNSWKENSLLNQLESFEDVVENRGNKSVEVEDCLMECHSDRCLVPQLFII